MTAGFRHRGGDRRAIGVAVIAAMVVAAIVLLPGPALADGGASLHGCPTDQSWESDAINIDYRWTPYAYRPSGAVGGVGLAQTLTVGRTGRLVGVSVRLAGDYLTGDLLLEIHRVAPDGTLLASATMARADLESPGWLDVAFDASINVHRGDVVAIVLPGLQPIYDADTALKQPTVTWVSSEPAVDGSEYVGGAGYEGERVNQDPGVKQWGEMVVDRHFRTYVCGVPATDTVSRASAGAGHGGVAWWFTIAVAVIAVLLADRRLSGRQG